MRSDPPNRRSLFPYPKRPAAAFAGSALSFRSFILRLLFLLVVLPSCLHAESIRLNEVMASTIADEDGGYGDWNELQTN